MKKLILIGLIVICPALAFAQGTGTGRDEMRFLVRDILGEPSTTYYADTTINRVLRWAHAQTKSALGMVGMPKMTRAALSANQIEYKVPSSGAVGGVGSVLGAMFWDASASQWIGLRRTSMELIGRLNGGYAVGGDTSAVIFLGFRAEANDSLVVSYVGKAVDLTADATKIDLSTEDALAVANLACSMLLQRDKQFTQSQAFYQMWSDYIDRKRSMMPTQGGGQ